MGVKYFGISPYCAFKFYIDYPAPVAEFSIASIFQKKIGRFVSTSPHEITTSISRVDLVCSKILKMIRADLLVEQFQSILAAHKHIRSAVIGVAHTF